MINDKLHTFIEDFLNKCVPQKQEDIKDHILKETSDLNDSKLTPDDEIFLKEIISLSIKEFYKKDSSSLIQQNIRL